MSAPFSVHREVVRLAAEAALLRRLDAGYGFAPRRGAAELFLRDDAARERVGRDALRPQGTHAAQLLEVEAALAEAAAAEEAAATPLTELAARLDLGAVERRLLCCALAFELDADLRDIAAELGGPGRRGFCAELCQDLFPAELGDAMALLEALHPRAPLLRYRLLELAGAGTGALTDPLRATRTLLDHLAGESRVPTPLFAAISEAAPGEVYLPEEVSDRVAALADLLAEPGARRRAAVLIQGGQGSGKRAVAARLAAALGKRILAAPLDHLVASEPGSRSGLLEDALALARVRDRVPYLPGIEALEPGEGQTIDRGALAALDAYDELVILASREVGIPPLRLDRTMHVVVVPRPTLDVRTAAWTHGLAELGDLSQHAEGLAARYVIGAGSVAEVIGDARRFAAATRRPLSVAAIDEAVSRRLSLQLGSLGQRITRQARIEEMVLPDDVVDTLRDIIAMVEGRSQILERWGYARHLGLSRGVSALFSGAPGTGKTMAASVIASALGLELFRIDLSAVVSKWVGETEKNLARIFDEAQDAQAMLLFDEADSLFGKRTEVQSSNDRYANLEVNYILQRMEQFDGVSVLTTNLESGIDQAFMRRLNFRVRFPEPEVEEREELWRKLVPPEAGLEGVDVSLLAERFEMTGGHIRNAIVRAAVVAAREGRPMRLDDLFTGAENEYYELGKVMHSDHLR